MRFKSPLVCNVLLAGLLCLFVPASATAGQIDALDGNLEDWGVSLGGWNGDKLVFGFSGLDLTTNTSSVRIGSGTATTSSGFQFQYFIEDQKDSSTGSLGPHSGGQPYDAEFLGVGVDDGYLVIAISTGQRYVNEVTQYSPGDIMIQTTSGVFGVEVGGSSRDGSNEVRYEAGVTPEATRLSGTYYKLYSNGYTQAAYEDSLRKAGSIWKDAEWAQTPISGDPQLTQFKHTQMTMNDGTLAGSAAEFLYSFPSGSKHAFIELKIPTSVFGITTIESVRWAPSCNNDFVETTNLNIHMPEPASISLLLIGGLGICGFCRRRKQTASVS